MLVVSVPNGHKLFVLTDVLEYATKCTYNYKTRVTTFV